MSDNPLWIDRLKNDVHELTGQKPHLSVVHLVDKGGRKMPTLQTEEGLAGYINYHLYGKYNLETHNATFPVGSMAREAIRVLERDYETFDVTGLLLAKRGIDIKFIDVINPQSYENLGEDPISDEELKKLREERDKALKSSDQG